MVDLRGLGTLKILYGFIPPSPKKLMDVHSYWDSLGERQALVVHTFPVKSSTEQVQALGPMQGCFIIMVKGSYY